MRKRLHVRVCSQKGMLNKRTFILARLSAFRVLTPYLSYFNRMVAPYRHMKIPKSTLQAYIRTKTKNLNTSKTKAEYVNHVKTLRDLTEKETELSPKICVYTTNRNLYYIVRTLLLVEIVPSSAN